MFEIFQGWEVKFFSGGGSFFWEGGRILLKIRIFSLQSFTMYTPRRTNLKFKILFEEDPVTIASAQQ